MDPGKLFIGGISWDTNEDSLREYFQNFGEVLETVIMKDRITGRARGFGFVVFLNPAVAERVVKEKHIIDGRTVEAKKAVPRDDQQSINRSNNGSIHGSPLSGQTSSTKKIFVGGLAPTVTEIDFKNYFDQFGMITDVVVMYDHNTQRPRGFGFITYKSEESVDKVLLKTFHELNGKLVEVKRAVPKELSPVPIRNYGLSRINSFVNGGYNSRSDARFSSVSGVRGGFPLFSLSNVGSNSDSGLVMNYGGNGIANSGVGYGSRVLNPMFSVTANRYDNPNGYASVVSSQNHNIWSNGSQNYTNGSLDSGNAFASGIGFGTNGAIWGNLDSNQGGIGGDRSSSFIRGNPIGYRRNGGDNITQTSLYGEIDGGASGGGGGDLFSVDPTWRPLSPELEVPGFFGYGFGNGSNRGIAA